MLERAELRHGTIKTMSTIKSKDFAGNGTSRCLQRLVSTRYQLTEQFENHRGDAVQFDRMRSPFYDGEKWAVRRLSSCLNKEGEWEYEPIPSSRDDDFYARCRFDSLDEAFDAWERANVEPSQAANL